MSELPTRPKNTQKALIDYYLSGHHSFIACDDKKQIAAVLNELKNRLLDEVSITLDCADFSTADDFSLALTQRTNLLLEEYGEQTLVCTQYPGSCLQILNDCLAKNKVHGYLILANVDKVISGQRTFEVEASLREVMQFRSDLAVLIAASESTIIAMSQYDRPFYLSFRIFWLNRPPSS